MHKQNLTDELSDLRTQIIRLQQREAQLQCLLAGAALADQPPARRPGWPIRRVPGETPAMH